MKIPPIALGELAGPQLPTPKIQVASPPREANSFTEVLGAMDRQLKGIEQQIQRPGLSVQELLGVQLKVHRLGVSAEMVAKISESVLSGVRRLQSQNS